MMDGHPMMAGDAKKKVTTVAPIREPAGSYPHNPLFDDVPAPKKPTKTHEDYAMGMDSDPLYEQIKLPKDQENLYPEPLNHLHQETKVSEKYLNPTGVQSGYLNGAMMIMVKPDGTMVRAYMPKDDDYEAMSIGREQLPTMEQLVRSFGTTRNILDESDDVALAPTAQPQRRQVAAYNGVRYQQPQTRSFFYHPSYLRQAYRSNQH